MLLNKILEFENNFAAVQAAIIEEPYGRLFYDVENPLCYDSNHAVINEDADYGFAVNELVRFYQSINISPRVYTFTIHECTIGKYLESKGFNRLTEEHCFFIQTNKASIDVRKTINIKRLNNIDDATDELLHIDEEQGEWGYKALIQSIHKEEFYLFGGYEHEKLVCIASLQVRDDISRIDHVFTAKDKRGNGYCSQLINFITDYNYEFLKTTSYLYANNPSAIKVYRKAGYEEILTMTKGCYWLD